MPDEQIRLDADAAGLITEWQKVAAASSNAAKAGYDLKASFDGVTGVTTQLTGSLRTLDATGKQVTKTFKAKTIDTKKAIEQEEIYSKSVAEVATKLAQQAKEAGRADLAKKIMAAASAKLEASEGRLATALLEGTLALQQQEVQMKKTSRSMAEAAAHARKLRQAQIGTEVGTFTGGLSRAGNRRATEVGATEAEIVNFRRQLAEVGKQFTAIRQTGQYSMDKVREAFNRGREAVKAGTVDFTKYNGELGKITILGVEYQRAHDQMGESARKAFNKARIAALQYNFELSRAARNARAATESAGAVGTNSTRGIRVASQIGQFVPSRAPAGANIAEQLRYQQQYQSLVNAVNQAVATQGANLRRIQQIWIELANGQVRQYSGALAKVQAQMIALRAAHETTGTAAQASFEKARRAGYEAGRTVDHILLSWKSLLRLVTVHITYRAIFGMANELRSAAEEAVKLSIQIAEIQTIDTSRSGFQEWADVLRELADAWRISLVDQAEAAYQSLSNQAVDSAAQFRVFGEEVNRFATATVSSAEDSVNLLTGVLNAYQLDIAEAQRISSIFFNTIEQGRVRASEMANSIGNVAILAAQLNIEIEELAATIATLTIQGVKYSESATQIRGIMIKLLKPTQEMKRFFRELGVESGEAAIRTYGFSGFLQLLEQRTRGSSTELAKYINRIRGISGALALTGESFEVYQANLAKIRNGLDDYLRAVDVVRNNQGFQIELNLEQLRNFLIQDVAGKLVDRLAAVTDNFAILIPVVNAFIKTINAALIPALSVLAATHLAKTTAAGTGLITVFRISAQAALLSGKATTVNAARVAALGSTYRFARASVLQFVAANKLLIGGLAIGGLVQGFIELVKASREASNEYRNLVETINANSVAQAERRINAFERRIQNLKSLVEQTTQPFRAEISREIGRLITENDKFAEAFGDNVEVFIGYADQLVDAASDMVDQVRSELSELNAAIEENRNAIADFPSRIEDINLRFDLKDIGFGTEDAVTDLENQAEQSLEALDKRLEAAEQRYRQYQELIRSTGQSTGQSEALRNEFENFKNRIEEQRKQIQEALDKDIRERQAEGSRQEADRIQERIDLLSQRLADAATAGDKERFENIVSELEKLEDTRTNILEKFRKENEEANYANDLRQRAIEQQEQILQQRQALDLALQGERVALELQLEIYKQGLESITAQVETLKNFKVEELFDLENPEEFRQKILEIQGILQGLSASGARLDVGDFNQQFIAEGAIENIGNVLANSLRIDELRGVIEPVVNSIDALKESLDTMHAELEPFESEFEDQKGTLRRFGEVLENYLKGSQSFGGTNSSVDDLIQRLLVDYAEENDQTLGELKEQIGDFIELLAQYRKGELGEEQFGSLLDAFDELRLIFADIAKASEAVVIGGARDGNLIQGIIDYFSQEERAADLAEFAKQLTEINRIFIGYQTGNVETLDELRAIIAEINGDISSTQDRLKAMSVTMEEAAKGLITASEKQVSASQKLFNSSTDLLFAAERLKEVAVQLARRPGRSTTFSRGGVAYMAAGGIAGLHPGQPRGTDTIPAWLTSGERVLSVQQNRHFENLVQTLGDSVYSRPSPTVDNRQSSTTSYGGVSVTINESRTPQQTADEVIRRIQSRQRMGTL